MPNGGLPWQKCHASLADGQVTRIGRCDGQPEKFKMKPSEDMHFQNTFSWPAESCRWEKTK